MLPAGSPFQQLRVHIGPTQALEKGQILLGSQRHGIGDFPLDEGLDARFQGVERLGHLRQVPGDDLVATLGDPTLDLVAARRDRLQAIQGAVALDRVDVAENAGVGGWIGLLELLDERTRLRDKVSDGARVGHELEKELEDLALLGLKTLTFELSSDVAHHHHHVLELPGDVLHRLVGNRKHRGSHHDALRQLVHAQVERQETIAQGFPSDLEHLPERGVVLGDQVPQVRALGRVPEPGTDHRGPFRRHDTVGAHGQKPLTGIVENGLHRGVPGAQLLRPLSDLALEPLVGLLECLGRVLELLGHAVHRLAQPEHFHGSSGLHARRQLPVGKLGRHLRELVHRLRQPLREQHR